MKFTSPSGESHDVPGFYASDGNGGASGNVWLVHFSPAEAGKWSFVALFRKGPQVAVSLDDKAGESTAFDCYRDSFYVEVCDENAPGFLKWGRLEYIGKHYLKFHDGPYWLKGGNDTPEDLLKSLLRYIGVKNYAFEFTDATLKRLVVVPEATSDVSSSSPASKGSGHENEFVSVAQVQSIIEASQAESAGLQKDDIILEYDGVPITSAQQLVS